MCSRRFSSLPGGVVVFFAIPALLARCPGAGAGAYFLCDSAAVKAPIFSLSRRCRWPPGFPAAVSPLRGVPVLLRCPGCFSPTIPLLSAACLCAVLPRNRGRFSRCPAGGCRLCAPRRCAMGFLLISPPRRAADGFILLNGRNFLAFCTSILMNTLHKAVF